mgnify:CR=1 FL=1
MSISKREKVWKKTESRYKEIVEKISKLPTQEEKKKAQNALSANDKQALMLYRIMQMQRQQEMQKTMQKQRTIAYEVNAKIQKMDETQKRDRLDARLVARGPNQLGCLDERQSWPSPLLRLAHIWRNQGQARSLAGCRRNRSAGLSARNSWRGG